MRRTRQVLISGIFMSFADLGLSPELLRAVTEAGYDTPTDIQASAIPSVLMMRDVIAIAQTGTGKTASFVLPMIDILAEGRARACPTGSRRGCGTRRKKACSRIGRSGTGLSSCGRRARMPFPRRPRARARRSRGAGRWA